jgi:hypothetical protein
VYPICSGKWCFYFHLILKSFISSLNSSIGPHHSKVYCSTSICSYIFCSFSSCWFPVLFHYDLVRHKKLFQFFVFVNKKCGLFYGLKCDLLWRMAHGLLRRMCIPQFFLIEYSIIVFKSIWSIIKFTSEVSLFIFCLDNLLVRLGYWNPPVFLCLDLSVPLYLVVFVLWNWTSQCSMYIYIYNNHIFLLIILFEST